MGREDAKPSQDGGRLGGAIGRHEEGEKEGQGGQHGVEGRVGRDEEGREEGDGETDGRHARLRRLGAVVAEGVGKDDAGGAPEGGDEEGHSLEQDAAMG